MPRLYYYYYADQIMASLKANVGGTGCDYLPMPWSSKTQNRTLSASLEDMASPQKAKLVNLDHLEVPHGHDNPCFITVEDEDGNVKHLKLRLDEDRCDPRMYLQKHPRPSIMSLPTSICGRAQTKQDLLNSKGEDVKLPSAADDKYHGFKKRLVNKDGRCNVEHKNVPRRKQAFLKDVFTTAVDMSWRYTLMAFGSSFMLTWFVFSVIWYIIVYAHGDLEALHLPSSEMQANGTWIPCVWAINNFASCFLFSIETQHTIGYGARATSEECPHAIITMCLQSIVGVLSSSCFAGIVFAKLARPKQRARTVCYSKNALITMINGHLYLIFRISNIRKSQLIESHVRAQLVRSSGTNVEGSTASILQEELKVSYMPENDPDDRAFVLVPNTIYHKIDEDSPFYTTTPKTLLESKFEMVVIFEGIVEPTGNSVQVRTSYLPREILWGYRFENMVSYEKGRYVVDSSYLNAVIPDETPRNSMKTLDEEHHHYATEDEETDATMEN